MDEETEAFLNNSSELRSDKKIGLWRILVVRNLPYSDPRRNGKVNLLKFVLGLFVFWSKLSLNLSSG